MDELEVLRRRAANGGYLHKEAFCLMKYSTSDGSEVEWIWNSRDGVTPFTIRSRSGAEMVHTQWQFDVRIKNYQPLSGERIFVDMTDGLAELMARTNVAAWWDHPDYPMCDTYPDQETAIAALAQEYLGDGDRPAVVDAAEWVRN
jgi:hypothetical protein